MALKPCRKSGEKVSLFAASCPSFGKKHPAISLIDFLIAVLLIAAVIWLSMPSNNHHEALKPAPIAAAPPVSPGLTVRILEPTIACPSSDSLMTVYRGLHPDDEPEPDPSNTALVLAQYSCTLLPAGSRVRVVSNGALVTAVAIAGSVSKDTSLYVRTADLLHQLGGKVSK